jgi:hypothetical protein
MNDLELLEDLQRTLNRKLSLAKTSQAFEKGTNKKTIDKLSRQIKILSVVIDSMICKHSTSIWES